MGDYQKTPTPNLIRHRNGRYYLRGRFGGEPVRESLRTKNYQTARTKLGIRLKKLREAAPARENEPVTLAQAVEAVRERVKADPSLKKGTQDSYAKNFDTLLKGKGKLPAGEIRHMQAATLRAWWAQVGRELSPQRANHMLMWVRQALALAGREWLAADLSPVKIPRKRLALLSGEQLRTLFAEMRRKRNRHDAHESADWVEFATYSGLRPGEQAALRWEDVGEEFIAVHGGEEGTKSRRMRRVPVTAALAALLADMRKRRVTRGVIFKLKTPPHKGLRHACKRLGFPHQRPYDLRHTFATMCAKAGVDVPTFSGWLGHKDGGALAMRVYVHTDEEHSREAAKKVRF